MAHYTIEIEITEDDFTTDGQLRSDRIFSFFQKASEGHVDSLGIGPDDLIKMDFIWVLTKMKLVYRDRINGPGRYLCTTYPVNQKRATFKRDYYINRISDGPDPDKALIIGASQWCILNYKTRKLEKTDIVFETAENEQDMIAGAFPKIHGSRPVPVMTHQVNAGDIDYNNHCNNTRYIALAEEAAGKTATEELFVNFASETRFGEIFTMFSEEQEKGTYIEGKTPEGERVFQIMFR